MALQYSISVGRASYEIDPEVDVTALQAEIESAVQSGGRFVRIGLLRGRSLEILVSPGLPVTFESFTGVAVDTIPAIEPSAAPIFTEYDEFDDL